MTKKRKPEVRRDLHFAGYDFTSGPSGTVIHRGGITSSAPGEDYGADPLGDGRFRMVPSGDVVDFEERNRRLARFHKLSSNPISTNEANTRWLIAKYGVTRAEAKQVVSTGDVRAVVRAHETWLKEHGYPAHNTPASRERLLHLAQFMKDWDAGASAILDPAFKRDQARMRARLKNVVRSNPLFRVGDRVTTESPTRRDGSIVIGWPDSTQLGTIEKIDHVRGVHSAYVRWDQGGANWRSLRDLHVIRGPMMPNPDEKPTKVISMYRYRGGAREKRLYGGQGTITEFWIYFGDEKEPMKIQGHGPTPGDRKTDAIARAKAIRAKQTLLPNPGGEGIVLGLLGLLALGIGWVALRGGSSSTPTPAPQKKCNPASFDALAKFASDKGYKIFYVENLPVAQWKPAGVEYLGDKTARPYSTADCGFFTWTGSQWVRDTATDGAFSTWFKANTEAGVILNPPATPPTPDRTFRFTPRPS